MLEEAYSKTEMKKTQVYRWHRSLRDYHARVNDYPRCVRYDKNTERVSYNVRSGRYQRKKEYQSEAFRVFFKKIYHCQHLFPKMLILVKTYFPMHNVMVLKELPYPPGLSPPNFLLFPRLKAVLKRQQLASAEGVTAKEH
jgi:hypothetical protein